MSEQRLREIMEREAKATKGPWVAGLRDWDEEGTVKTWQVWSEARPINLATLVTGVRQAILEEEVEANVQFAANARQDIPFLLSALQAATERATALREALIDEMGECDCEKEDVNPLGLYCHCCGQVLRQEGGQG